MPHRAKPDKPLELEPLSCLPEDERYVLRLYVTGLTSLSSNTIASLRKLCEVHLAGRYDLQVIDLYQQPELARHQACADDPDLRDPRWLGAECGGCAFGATLDDIERVDRSLRLRHRCRGAPGRLTGKLQARLVAIQRGEAPDVHGWVMRLG